jgi:uncharacterized protein YeaO (DUF488 family)
MDKEGWMIKIKRIYESPTQADGRRYLVERLWPRGVRKQDARLEDWLKDLAPSAELRRWYGHELTRWPEFVRRYVGELSFPEKEKLLRKLAEEASTGSVTLVFATKDPEHSSARVLKEFIEEKFRRSD